MSLSRHCRAVAALASALALAVAAAATAPCAAADDLTLEGPAGVMTDAKGRLVIAALDPAGDVVEAFLFAPARPLGFELPRHVLARAEITYGQGRVRLVAPDAEFDLAVGPPDAAPTLASWRGRALPPVAPGRELARYRAGRPLGLDAFRLGSFAGDFEPAAIPGGADAADESRDPSPRDKCTSGGPGATQCKQTCPGGLSCEVTCGVSGGGMLEPGDGTEAAGGRFACCGCWLGFIARCVCIDE